MAAAANSDCEKKKLVSRLKKHRKKTTKASRLARNSKVLSASNTMISVTPGSRPRKVPKLKKVAPRAAISSSSSHQRLGSGRALRASQVRQHRTPPVNRLHHRGTWLICGISTQAITARVNSVSLASRGIFCRADHSGGGLRGCMS